MGLYTCKFTLLGRVEVHPVPLDSRVSRRPSPRTCFSLTRDFLVSWVIPTVFLYCVPQDIAGVCRVGWGRKG